jgi:hypothetical protein
MKDRRAATGAFARGRAIKTTVSVSLTLPGSMTTSACILVSLTLEHERVREHSSSVGATDARRAEDQTLGTRSWCGKPTHQHSSSMASQPWAVYYRPGTTDSVYYRPGLLQTRSTTNNRRAKGWTCTIPIQRENACSCVPAVKKRVHQQSYQPSHRLAAAS